MDIHHSWAYEVLNENAKKKLDSGKLSFNDNILECTINNSDSKEFHEKHTKGAFLRKFKEVKYHQVNWESPYYFKLFDKYLSGIDLSRITILDFGCGDGRFTEYLLKKGATRIISVDFDYKLLVELSSYIESTDNSDKVFLIHSDLANLPIKGESADVLLTIGVLYYYNELYESCLGQLKALLKQDGIFITSDPNLEGFILSALIFENLNDALDTFEQRRFNEVKGNNNLTFRAFTQNELKDIYNRSGFEIMDKQGITLFHKIVRILQLRGQISEADLEKNEERIKTLFDFLGEEGSLFKHLVWKLKKR